jgi:hypothetical protein
VTIDEDDEIVGCRKKPSCPVLRHHPRIYFDESETTYENLSI